MRRKIASVIVLTAIVAGGVLVLRPHDRLARARTLMARGDMRGAALDLRDYVRNRPGAEAGGAEAGGAQAGGTQAPGTQARDAEARDAEAWYRLGVAELAIGNAVAAERDLKAARLAGWDPNATIAALGQAYLAQQQPQAALRDFDADAAPPSARAAVLGVRARAYLALHQFPEATAAAAAAEQAAPDAIEPKLAAAEIDLARGQGQAAEAAIGRALALQPGSVDARLLLGQARMAEGDLRGGLRDTQAAIAAAPGRVDARLQRARAEAALGQDGPARAELEWVLKQQPGSVAANFLSAVLAVHSHDYATADRALQLISPVLTQVPKGEYFEAATKLGLHRLDEAEAAGRRYVARAPEDPAGAKLLAAIEIESGRPEPARAALRPFAQSGDAEIHDLLGRAAQLGGDQAGAVAELERASALAPRDPAILTRLGQARLNLGDPAAEGDLEKSLALAPDQPQAAQALVQSALARGDTAHAAALVRQLRAGAGDIETVAMLDALVELAGADLAAAETRLAAALQRFPQSRTLPLVLARLQLQRGETEAARATLQGVLTRDPADVAALSMLMPVLYAQNQTEPAIRLAIDAEHARPGDPELVAMGVYANLRGGHADAALALLDRASGTAGNPALLRLRAQAQLAARQTLRAADTYRQILQLNPADDGARRDLASLLVGSRDLAGARAVLADGLAARPQDNALLGSLVGVDFASGGLAPALATARRLAADPAHQPAAFGLEGDAYMAAKRPADAARAYLAALQAAPSGELALRAAAAQLQANDIVGADRTLHGWLAAHPGDVAAAAMLGTVELGAGRLEQARGHLEAVAAARPGDAAVLNNLAWIYQQTHDPRALATAEQAYFVAPAPDIADTLGWILVQAGQPQRAVGLLAGAAQAAPKPSVRYHYAAALSAAGQPAEAAKVLHGLLASPAPFPERPDAAALLAKL